ncbi:hypothetical protein G7062_10430 [Erysipelothrix sp. HDW6C]|uniref:hypothetical protein n=1 Tax=Erysipelothrix sp. HDW6C TaxID=2714930 RepID=UPI00140A1B58|nr:hypothetical protein [Erysipelothrix sp. HDW6C]QIK70693.1 hypothetical protein G7062_10430 [Erysipelothrix sp. HDW6C]
MSRKLELSIGKLERLRTEVSETYESARAESRLIPFGQANIIGRPNIYKGVQAKYAKVRKLLDEVDKQEQRVEKIEKVEQFKEDNELIKDVHVVGKSRYATVGAKTSVNNVAYFEDKLAKMIELNEASKAHNKRRKADEPLYKTFGTQITALRRKVESLKAIESKSKDDASNISESAQRLIDDGQVRQWLKKPIYYFVTGLRKVALELNEDGEFIVSKRYYPSSAEDKQTVSMLIGKEVI